MRTRLFSLGKGRGEGSQLTPASPPPRAAAPFAFLAFLTLVTFSVSQSVYDMLAANQVFLVLRAVSNWQLLEVIAVFNLLPAVALFLFWLLLRKLHPSPARFFLAASVGALSLLLFLPVHKLYFAARGPLAGLELLWIIPAALAGWAAVRFANSFRLFVLALPPAGKPGLWRELSPPASAAATRSPPARSARTSSQILLQSAR